MDALLDALTASSAILVRQAALSVGSDLLKRLMQASTPYQAVEAHIISPPRTHASQSTTDDDTCTPLLDQFYSRLAYLYGRQQRFDQTIRMVVPVMSRIQAHAARGKSSLLDTVAFIESLKADIVACRVRLDEFLRRHGLDGKAHREEARDYQWRHSRDGIDDATDELNEVIEEFDAVFKDFVDRGIPVLHLGYSMCASGGEMRAGGVSVSRMLQASDRLSRTNNAFHSATKAVGDSVVVGEAFTVRLYTLFRASVRRPPPQRSNTAATSSLSSSMHDFSWKEEYALATAQLHRVYHPQCAYSYALAIAEDFRDGRYHDDDDVARQRRVEVRDVQRMWYATSGRLLRIGDEDSPVLVIKIVPGPLEAGRGTATSDEFGFVAGGGGRGGRVDWIALELYRTVLDGDNDAVRSDSSNSSDDGELVELSNRSDGGDNEDTVYYDADVLSEGSRVVIQTPLSESDEASESESKSESESDDTESAPESPSLRPSRGVPVVAPSRPTARVKFRPLPRKSLPRMESLKPRTRHMPSERPPAQQDIGALSLLEHLMRLAGLEQHTQRSHMDVDDDTIGLFMTSEKTADSIKSNTLAAESHGKSK